MRTLLAGYRASCYRPAPTKPRSARLPVCTLAPSSTLAASMHCPGWQKVHDLWPPPAKAFIAIQCTLFCHKVHVVAISATLALPYILALSHPGNLVELFCTVALFCTLAVSDFGIIAPASSRTLAMPGCCCFAAYTFQQPLDSGISLYLSTFLHLNRANSPSMQPGTYNVALHLTSLILHLEKLKLHCFSRLWLQFAAALFGNSLFQNCIVLAQHLQFLHNNVLQ